MSPEPTEAGTPRPFDAVLLMGYGSPSGPADLPEYLTEVMHGRRPSPEVVADFARRYERIGGSPQAKILASLRSKLESRLARERRPLPVYLGTKHWHPNIAEVVPRIRADGHRQVVAVPLSPYASTWIMEPYEAAVKAGTAAAGGEVTVELRAGWHLDPHWIGYWAKAIREAWRRLDDPTAAVHLSVHSLPQRYRDQGDPYPGLVRATADAVAAAAGLDRWSFTYQSPGNTTEPWLGPDITEQIVAWKERGARRQIVASIGFVFDHLEVLYDLDVVVREFAEAAGVEYHRVPMPNDGPEVVEALAACVTRPASSG